MKKRTVTISVVPDYPALKMKMDTKVKSVDMQFAYMDIERQLNNFDQPIYIVVDLTQNDQLPLQATISGALFGPYLNPMIRGWLVVGEHTMGKHVAKQLSFWTGKEHVMWFDTCDECLDYIQDEMLEAFIID